MGPGSALALLAWPGRQHLNLDHLPRLQGHKFFPRNLGFIERLAQRGDRRVNRFVGELEGAVVIGQRLLRAAIGQRMTASAGFMCWSFMNQRGS
jgi:hypothetical protein